jgi:hypothetical protein
MNPENLIFNSDIAAEVKEWAFGILLNHLDDIESKVYVKNLVAFNNKILFMVKIDDIESIIQVPLEID